MTGRAPSNASRHHRLTKWRNTHGTVTAEQNKEIITGFIAGLVSDAPGAVAELLDDDANWWVAGALPLSGDHTKSEMIEVVKAILSQFGSNLELTVRGMTAEGNPVVAEVRAKGLADGTKPYLNDFHFLFTITNGKISGVKEYMDTHEIHTVFFAA